MFRNTAIRACRVTVLSPFIVAGACSAQTWTEARVLELFTQGSPQAAAARAQVAVTRAEARGRALYSNPSLGYSREGAGFTEFFQAEQALPVSGRIGILRQSVAPAVAAAEADADALVWQLRADVRLAFHRLLASQGREEVLGATIEDLRQVIQILVSREKEGEGSRFDRLRWEREMVEIGAELGIARTQSRQAKARLLEYLPQGTEVSRVEGPAAGPGELPALDDLLARALAARPEIRADKQLIARFSLEEQAARRLRYPEPVLAAGLKRADVAALGGMPLNRTENGLYVGLAISIPAFNRGQGEVARLQAEQARIEAHRRAFEHQIRTQVTGAYQLLVSRNDVFQSYRRELGERNEELLTIARTAYEEGAVGILELVDVFRLQRQSQQRVIELGLGVKEALIELERALGQEATK